MNTITRAYHRLRAEGERQSAQEASGYSRGSMRIGALAAGLSGVSTTLFVEALVTSADIDTDIITATPAVGFAALSYLILSDSLRTSREAGTHQAQADQHLSQAESGE